jgi:hypothetical protein
MAGKAGGARAELARWGLVLTARRTLTLDEWGKAAVILRAAREAAETGGGETVGRLSYPDRRALNAALATLRAHLTGEYVFPGAEPATVTGPEPVGVPVRHLPGPHPPRPGEGW